LAALPPLEIRALVKIIDELDYYQILHLEPEATATEVKKAYFHTSRIFHPDANRHLEEALRDECSHISKRVTEAYCVLRDPRRRAAYDDQRRSEGGGPRMQLAEARASHVKKDAEERQGKTPQGRQFFGKASTAIDRGDTAGAINHLQMALTFEPQNEYFKTLLAELKQQS
jgi:DnaJ-class molecular chaperone